MTLDPDITTIEGTSKCIRLDGKLLLDESEKKNPPRELPD
jgi:hypothetical protein